MTSALDQVPYIHWDDFHAGFQWHQGEHVSMVGHNGSGKTTLAFRLLGRRNYVTVLATKPGDETLDEYAKAFKRMKRWNPRLSPDRHPHRLLWPDLREISALRDQAPVYAEALRAIYHHGGWCLVVDEGAVLADMMGLKRDMRVIWTQGRSSKISFVCLTQRPFYVPLEMYSEATHLFFWRQNDRQNLDRISGIAYMNNEFLRDVVSRLPKHEFLYVNTRDNTLIRSMAPPLKTSKGGAK